MADVDANDADVKEKPKPKKKVKAAGGGGGGGMGTIIASVVAVAAVIMCVVLFMQLQTLQKKLGEAGVETPAGLNGAAMAAESGHGDAHGEDAYDWQADPITDIIYPLGEFTANTADNKYAKMDLSLILSSGISSHAREAHQVAIWTYEMQLEEYNKALADWKKKNKISSAAPWRKPLRQDNPQLVRGGLILLMHGAAPAETGPPEMPHPPVEPRTVLENELDGLQPRIRELIIDKINASTSDELTTSDGKANLKTAVIDGITTMVKPYNGRITGMIISDIILTK